MFATISPGAQDTCTGLQALGWCHRAAIAKVCFRCTEVHYTICGGRFGFKWEAITLRCAGSTKNVTPV